MAAFLLVKNSSLYNLQKALSYFKERGLSKPQQIEIGEYSLYYYKKILVDVEVHLSQANHQLIVCGTLIYQSLSHDDSIKQLLDDIIRGKLDHQKLLGNFCFIHIYKNDIHIYSDALGIQNIYYNTKKDIFSSSFLALAYLLPSISINKLAATESICTGSLIGPDTLLNEVQRVEPHLIPESKGIKISYIDKPIIDSTNNRSFKDEIEFQLAVLQNYFHSFKNLADEFGVDSGITGGHDSRLIMAHAQKYWENVTYHSHFRKVKDEELSVAEEVCKEANVPLKQVYVKHPLDMSNEEFEEVMHRGFLFYDGHVKMHAFWMEEYNTAFYRQKVLGDSKFAVSGIGGEQYRNMEGMFMINWHFRNYIKYAILLNSCGHSFKNLKSENEMVNYLFRKIATKLRVDYSLKKMDKLLMKKYLNEVFIPARLGMRNNAENTLSFFVSPFIDAQVSIPAYSAISHLGIAYQFQEKMLTKLNPQLASVRSSYGFNFIDGEPFLLKVKQFIRNIIPQSILQNRIDKNWKNNDDSLFLKLKEKHSVCIDYVENVRKLKLDLDVDKIMKRRDLIPLVLNLGFLLSKISVSKEKT